MIPTTLGNIIGGTIFVGLPLIYSHAWSSVVMEWRKRKSSEDTHSIIKSANEELELSQA